MKSGPHDSQNRALVATLNVGQKKKVSTRVPDLRVNKLEKGQSIKIDGKLDDEAWAKRAKSAEIGASLRQSRSPGLFHQEGCA